MTARRSEPAAAGGVLGSLTSALLLLFVMVTGAALYYSQQPVEDVLVLLSADRQYAQCNLRPSSARAHEQRARTLCAGLLKSLDGVAVYLPETGRIKLAAVLLLATQRLLWFASAWPFVVLLLLWGLLEGLWARSRNAVGLGYSSATLFALGKFLLIAGCVWAVCIPVLPVQLASHWSTAGFIALAALGIHCSARSLPLRL